jgi:ATP-binding cassette subfamily B protein
MRTMSIIRAYAQGIGFLSPEKWLAISLVCLNLLIAGVSFFEPYLFGHVVDALASKDSGSAWRLISIWASVGLGGVIASVWVSLHADRLAHRRRLAAIAAFFAHVMGQPVAFHGRYHTGRLLRIMNTGALNLFNLWLGLFREQLVTVFCAVFMLPIAFWMNWQLALLMIGLVIGFACFNTLAMRWTLKAQRDVEDLQHSITERAGDLFGNVSVIQSFTRVAAEVLSLLSIMKRVTTTQAPVLRGWAWLTVANRAVSTLTFVAIFALGTHLHAMGAVSVGEIVTFVGFATVLIGRLERLAGFIGSSFLQAHSVADFFEILETPNELHEQSDAIEVSSVRGDVEFELVSFGYDPSKPTIKDLSFKVAAGTTVAIVGATGAGKSTAMSLLYRAYDPTEGRIMVDGIDIREINLASLRQAVAVVFQEPSLLYRSITENLLVGDAQASSSELEAAARAAEAHDFIVEKPKRYETMVAERGRSLSGGERQRLAIARAMLKNAPILILDEATSALDRGTELRVERALRSIMRDRTTFVIAHRLSTIKRADMILVMEDGRIVERGGYDDLIALGGVFARLADQGETLSLAAT